MKKIAVFAALFFMIFSQAFGEEPQNKFENTFFLFQTYVPVIDNQGINFLNLNPAFFASNNGLINFGNITTTIDSQPSRRTNVSSQSVALGLLGLTSLWALSAAAYPSDRQGREVYNNTWQQQRDREMFNRRIFNDRNRIYSGNQ